MKNLFFWMGIYLLMFQASYGQNGNLNHATIDSVKVSYKGVEQVTLTVGSDVQAVPQATVSLKSSTVTVSKIYFIMRDAVSDSILYQVNYNLSSGIQQDSEGFVLFEILNGEVHISPGQAVALKPYTYEVLTEDSLQNQTAIFSVIQ